MASVDIVADGYTLSKIRDRTKESEFLIFWIDNARTNLVVPKTAWNQFSRALEKEYTDSGMKETYMGVIAFFRGIATPYRDKYAGEAGLTIDEDEELQEKDEAGEEDEKSVIINIVNRHYATVKYLVVENPKLYRELKDGIKIKAEKKIKCREHRGQRCSKCTCGKRGPHT